MNTENRSLTVADLGDMSDGDMRTAMVANRPALVAKVGGALYAVDAQCTHDGGPLIEGEIEGDTIVCPWHFSRFCLRTGHVIDSPALHPLRTYALQIVDGSVHFQKGIEDAR